VLTLVMVPVMITAPSVIGGSVRSVWEKFSGRTKEQNAPVEQTAGVQLLATDKKPKAKKDMETAAE